jgi:hypothetical protein
MSPLQHNVLPQYRPSTYSDNSGVNRSLFNSQSQQFRSSPGRSTSSGGHQVPVSACHQLYYILAPPQQQLSGGIAEGFLLPNSTYNPLYPNMSIPVGLGTTHKPISSPPSSDLVTGDQFCMAAESVGTDREVKLILNIPPLLTVHNVKSRVRNKINSLRPEFKFCKI